MVLLVCTVLVGLPSDHSTLTCSDSCWCWLSDVRPYRSYICK